MMTNIGNDEIKKVKKTVKKVLCVVGGLTIVGGIGFAAFKLGALSQKISDDGLFGSEPETEVNVTIYDVEHEITQIGEWATAEDTYTGTSHYYAKDKKEFPIVGEVELPGTSRSADINYTGIVKVGYEMEDIKTSIDRLNKEIEVTLPEPVVLDNYIDDWTPEDEKEGVFANLTAAEIDDYIENTLEPEGLAKAEREGIYEEAEESVKKQIESQLGCFEKYGYSVVFTTVAGAK